MELFLFILSFITGGVVFTTIYTISLTNRLNNSVSLLESDLEEYQGKSRVVEKSVDILDSNIKNLEEKLNEDGYSEISKINRDLLVIKDQINSLGERINLDKVEYNGEIRRLNGSIQNTVKMINAVKEDPNTLSRY
tara:strand:- start:95 stop:502 length:408 start_codon:yes stop_codon:yes gene_type:complete